MEIDIRELFGIYPVWDILILVLLVLLVYFVWKKQSTSEATPVGEEGVNQQVGDFQQLMSELKIVRNELKSLKSEGTGGEVPFLVNTLFDWNKSVYVSPIKNDERLVVARLMLFWHSPQSTDSTEIYLSWNSEKFSIDGASDKSELAVKLESGDPKFLDITFVSGDQGVIGQSMDLEVKIEWKWKGQEYQDKERMSFAFKRSNGHGKQKSGTSSSANSPKSSPPSSSTVSSVIAQYAPAPEKHYSNGSYYFQDQQLSKDRKRGHFYSILVQGSKKAEFKFEAKLGSINREHDLICCDDQGASYHGKNKVITEVNGVLAKDDDRWVVKQNAIVNYI